MIPEKFTWSWVEQVSDHNLATFMTTQAVSIVNDLSAEAHECTNQNVYKVIRATPDVQLVERLCQMLDNQNIWKEIASFSIQDRPRAWRAVLYPLLKSCEQIEDFPIRMNAIREKIQEIARAFYEKSKRDEPFEQSLLISHILLYLEKKTSSLYQIQIDDLEKSLEILKNPILNILPDTPENQRRKVSEIAQLLSALPEILDQVEDLHEIKPFKNFLTIAPTTSKDKEILEAVVQIDSKERLGLLSSLLNARVNQEAAKNIPSAFCDLFNLTRENES